MLVSGTHTESLCSGGTSSGGSSFAASPSIPAANGPLERTSNHRAHLLDTLHGAAASPSSSRPA